MTKLVERVQIIRHLEPEIAGPDLVARLQLFDQIAHRTGAAMSGKNQDYQQGYQTGQYMNESGQDDYDFKDLDQLANEIYEETDWQDLGFENLEAFKDGLANGYTIPEYWSNERDK